MNFLTVATLTNQTAVITPRNSGQVIRLGAQETTTVAGVPVRVYGTGPVEVSEGWWDDIAIFAGDSGESFYDGNTNPQAGDFATERTRWLGPVNGSQSVFETRVLVAGNPSNITKIQSGPWIGGQGNSGCRFSGAPTYINNGPYGGGRVGFAATFIETGDWVYG